MNNFIQKLKEYFTKTPRSSVLKVWENTKMYDNINSPKIKSCFKYNHDRPLSDFQHSIDKIKTAGFNPIGVTQIFFKDTFIFNTKEEALNAYQKLERDLDRKNRIIGYWYGKDEFDKTVRDYEESCEGFIKVYIHWID